MGIDPDRNTFIERLFCNYHDVLKKECIRYVRYDSKFLLMVDDCIQETFIKAIVHYEQLQSHPNIVGWLVRCCKNSIKLDLRKYKRRGEIVSGSMDTVEHAKSNYEGDAFERWLSKKEALETLDLLYEALSPKECAIFQDYFVNDLSAEETADKNGLSKSAVQSGVTRIRKKINKIFHIVVFFSVAQHIFDFLMHYNKRRG
jgi:RNA polymerase sigma-70 factor (ECF subfamily)